MRDIWNKTSDFLRRAFVANPSYSFGDWRIMYNHSVRVAEFAGRIAKEVPCDQTVVTVGALLHDIGKTYPADAQTLRKDHGKLGYEVSRGFLSELPLSGGQVASLREILSGEDGGVEGRIIKDADVIAFFADATLQQALKNWADQNGLPNDLARKIGKADSLHFEVSRVLARDYLRQMRNRWGL